MELLFSFLNGVSRQVFFMAVSSVWLGVSLTLAVTLMWRYARRVNAATRYGIWWTTLVVVTILPIFLGIVGERALVPQLFSELESSSATGEAHPGIEGANSVSLTPAELLVTETKPSPSLVVRYQQWEPSETDTQSLSMVGSSFDAATAGEDGVDGHGGSPVLSILPGLLPISIFGLWLCGTLLCLGRLVAASRRVHRIKLRSRPLDYRDYPWLGEILQRTGLRRPVCVCITREVDLPMAAGLGQPVILLPEALLPGLAEDELRAIIIHELAHLRRWDDWGKLAQQFLLALGFFNPAVHWIASQLDLEREVAADDQVVAEMGRTEEYARCLTRLAQVSCSGNSALVPGVLAGRKQIFKRFHRLLHRNGHGGVRFSGSHFLVSLMAVFAVMLVTVQLAPAISAPGDPIEYEEFSRVLEGAVAAIVPAPPDIDEADDTQLGDIELSADDPSVDGPVMPKDMPGLPKASETTPESAALPAIGTPPDIDLTFTDSVGLDETTSIDAFDPEDIPLYSDLAVPDDGDSEWFAELSEDEEDVARRDWKIYAPDMAGIFGADILSRSITEGDDTLKIVWSSGPRKMTVSECGEITFTPDDSDVESISDDGYLSVVERNGRKWREIEIKPGRDGSLEYAYREQKRRHEFDAEARKWLNEILPEAIRTTGIGAEGRVARIRREGGVSRVLEEIVLLDGDYVRSQYYLTLMGSGSLSEGELSMVLNHAGKFLEHDYEIAEFLIENKDAFRRNKKLLMATIDIVEDMESDYDKRRVVSELDLDKDTDAEILARVLELTLDMDSDYDRAEMLIDMSGRSLGDRALSSTYFDAVEALDSDHEKWRVLDEVSALGELDHQTVEKMLSTVESMESDFEKAELLTELSAECDDDPDLKHLVLDATRDLDSDFDASRVLQAQDLDCAEDPETALLVLAVISRMSSDHTRAELLIEMAECAGANDSTREAYFDVLQDIDSDYDRSRVIRRLMESKDMDEATTMEVIRVIEDFDSDYEKAGLLVILAPFCEGNESLKEAFLDAVDSMDSEHETARNLYSRMYGRSRR